MGILELAAAEQMRPHPQTIHSFITRRISFPERSIPKPAFVQLPQSNFASACNILIGAQFHLMVTHVLTEREEPYGLTFCLLGGAF